MFKIFKKYRFLIKFAEEHQKVPVVRHNERHLGIILSFVGWLLIAFFTVAYSVQANKFIDTGPRCLTKSFFEFTIFHLGMFSVFAPLCFFQGGVNFLKCKEPKLMFWRTTFAIIGFWTYSLARVWTDIFDLSLLYSTDAIWIVIILALLGIKIDKYSIIGIFISLIGIFYVYQITFEFKEDMIGAYLGSLSGLTLALITIITSYLVKKDPPLRIGFYHSSAGIISSFILSIFFGLIQGWSFPHYISMINMLFSGFFFAFAVFCLWECLYFAELHIIGAISYALPVFVIIIAWILVNEHIELPEAIGAFIIICGSSMTIVNSFIKDRKTKTKHYIDGKPVIKKEQIK